MIEGQASDWLNLTSGVPQGSILGPLLFLVYINDLPYSVTCNADSFADDTVLHRHIANGSDCDLLQEDLTSASDWCKSWLVTLKTQKCEVLHIYSGVQCTVGAVCISCLLFNIFYNRNFDQPK